MKIQAVVLSALAATALAAPNARAPDDHNEVRWGGGHAARAADEVEQHAEKRGIWMIALVSQTLFRYVMASLNFFDEPPNAWEVQSGNCVIEVKANTHTSGDTQCSISASPPGDEGAFTEITEWQDCSVNAMNEFTFPDAPDRASVGKVQVQWTVDGGAEGDGFWAPELGFMDLDPPVYFRPEDSLKDQGNVICDLTVDDGSLSDGWSGWNSYKCGVPCRDSPEDFTIEHN